MGLPFIGSSIDDPLFLRSSNLSSLDRRTNRSFPNTPKNMFPLTKAEMLPNIGRTITRSSFGTRDWKRFTDSLSGRGIFNPYTHWVRSFNGELIEFFETLSGRSDSSAWLLRRMGYPHSGEYS